jgi:hypothetical protein
MWGDYKSCTASRFIAVLNAVPHTAEEGARAACRHGEPEIVALATAVTIEGFATTGYLTTVTA